PPGTITAAASAVVAGGVDTTRLTFWLPVCSITRRPAIATRRSRCSARGRRRGTLWTGEGGGAVRSACRAVVLGCVHMLPCDTDFGTGLSHRANSDRRRKGNTDRGMAGSGHFAHDHEGRKERTLLLRGHSHQRSMGAHGRTLRQRYRFGFAKKL